MEMIMKFLTYFAVAMATKVVQARSESVATTEKPNIVIILTDDVGCVGKT